jgi:hypothetical protein
MAYWSLPLSTLCTTWNANDWRTYKIALRERCCGWIFSLIAELSSQARRHGTSAMLAQQPREQP